DKLALSRRATDFNHFAFGIDDQGDLSAAGEKVLQAVVYLGAGVVGGENLDRQVRRAGKEASLGRLKAQTFQPGLGNEGHIRGAAVSVKHPKARAGVEHSAETVVRYK